MGEGRGGEGGEGSSVGEGREGRWGGGCCVVTPGPPCCPGHHEATHCPPRGCSSLAPGGLYCSAPSGRRPGRSPSGPQMIASSLATSEPALGPQARFLYALCTGSLPPPQRFCRRARARRGRGLRRRGRGLGRRGRGRGGGAGALRALGRDWSSLRSLRKLKGR